MENQKNHKSQTRAQKQNKDFLYKIAKLQQNKILNDRTNGQDNDLNLETALKPINPNVYNFDDFQQQFEGLQMPSYQREQSDSQGGKENIQSQKTGNQQNNNIQVIASSSLKINAQMKNKLILRDQQEPSESSQQVPTKMFSSPDTGLIQQIPFSFDDEEYDLDNKIQNNKYADYPQIQKQEKEKLEEIKFQSDFKRNQKSLGNLKNHKPFLFDEDSFQETFEKNQLPKQEVLTQQIKQYKKDLQKNQNEQIKPQNNGQKSSSSSYSGSDQQIKGVSMTSNSLSGNVIIKITNKKELVISKIPPGIILKCILRRSNNIFNPQYDFYLNNGLKHILSAKKYSLSKRQVFKLSLEIGDYSDRNIVGTVMTNTVHNKYWFYKQQINEKHMQIKCIIKYDKIRQKSREMKAEMFIDKKKQVKIDSVRMGHDLMEEGDLELKTTQAKEKQYSNKNYILCDNQDQQYQYIKMYKMSDNVFAVDIQHPISPIQAFAVSLTRFDAELK